MRKCSKCGKEKPLDSKHFYKSKQNKLGFHMSCRSCWDAVTSAYNKAHPEIRKKLNDRWKNSHKEEIWIAYILRTYNTSSEWYYKQLAKQEGLCAVCLRLPIPGERLRIDHDHLCCPQSKGTCGQCNRGLVHHKCNSALGLLDDDSTICRLAGKYLDCWRNRKRDADDKKDE